MARELLVQRCIRRSYPQLAKLGLRVRPGEIERAA
jgi:hypothetical protein